jgi:hypothetical protein
MTDTGEIAPVFLEIPGDQALVVSDLLLKPYIRHLQHGGGVIEFSPELRQLLEPARKKIYQAIRPKVGCRVELGDEEGAAIGYALASYLVQAKRAPLDDALAPLPGGLEGFQMEALQVFAGVVAYLGEKELPVAARLYAIGYGEGFFAMPDDDESDRGDEEKTEPKT